jgi:hypothetical protein
MTLTLKEEVNCPQNVPSQALVHVMCMRGSLVKEVTHPYEISVDDDF